MCHDSSTFPLAPKLGKRFCAKLLLGRPIQAPEKHVPANSDGVACADLVAVPLADPQDRVQTMGAFASKAKGLFSLATTAQVHLLWRQTKL
jgi:hypothetical protein